MADGFEEEEEGSSLNAEIKHISRRVGTDKQEVKARNPLVAKSNVSQDTRSLEKIVSVGNGPGKPRTCESMYVSKTSRSVSFEI